MLNDAPAPSLATMTMTTLAILAGGAGSRMGVPKATLTVAGVPILHYLLDRFVWPGPTILVTAPGRDRPPGWERFSAEVQDRVPGEGPLRGVQAALAAATTDVVVVATVDMPGVESAHLAWLAGALAARPGAAGVILQRGAGTEYVAEPFPCAIRSTARAAIDARLAAGRRSVHGLLDEPGFVSLRVPAEAWPDDAWTNLNTPGELDAFRARAERDA